MNLLLFLFLSITNGDYRSDSMHDVGTGDDLSKCWKTRGTSKFAQTLDTGPCELKS